MNVDAAEVVNVAVANEEGKDVAGAEAEDEITIPIHYIVHMVMELLFLKLIYMIKVNINHCPEINKLKFNNSEVRLVGSMYIPRVMDMI